MTGPKTCRARGAGQGARILALGLVLLMTACAVPASPGRARGVCLESSRVGLAILCCPDGTGRQKCFLSRGGIEI